MMLRILLIVTVCYLTAPSHGQGSSGFLLFTDSSQSVIYKANSRGYGLLSSPGKVIIHSSFSPQAVTYDPLEQRVYWSDTFTRIISRAFLNGSSEQTVVRYVRAVAIAVDSAGRNLYWADNKKGRIEVAKLDGTHRKILVRTRKPTDMVLDLTRRQMYWSSDGFSTAVIERSSMDGSDRQVIVSGLIFGTPSGLCLDSSKRMLYWTEKNTPDVFYVSLDNPGGQHYHFHTGSSKPFRLTILDQRIYWTDRGIYSYHGKVASVNVTTKRDFKILTNNVGTPKGIYSFAGDGSPIPKSNCSKSNGGCSHLCLLNPRKDVCACSNGMALKDDGKTCHYKEFLLVVDYLRRKIFHKSLDDLSHPKTPLSLGQTGRIMTVDFDPQEHKIYWTTKRGEISRAFLNGSSIETVLSSDDYIPRGHAIDVIGRNIYWFDSTYHEIGVCKLDGSYQRLLIPLNDKPKAMVLDSSKGLIYWATTGSTAKIQRVQMNGEKREVILHFPRRYYSPRALAVDSQNNRLYWVDDNRGELCYTETNPKTGQIHRVGIPLWYLHSPYSLALKEDYIYWGDGSNAAVYRVNKTSTTKVQKIVRGVDPEDLHVYHNNTEILDNNHPCAQFNGWCTHLCLLKPGGYSCVCPSNKGSRPCYTTPITPTPPPTSSVSKPLSSTSSSFPASSFSSAYIPRLESSSSDVDRKTTRVPPDRSTTIPTSSKHYATATASSSPIRLQPESTLEPSTFVSSSLSEMYLTTSHLSSVSSSPSPSPSSSLLLSPLSPSPLLSSSLSSLPSLLSLSSSPSSSSSSSSSSWPSPSPSPSSSLLLSPLSPSPLLSSSLSSLPSLLSLLSSPSSSSSSSSPPSPSPSPRSSSLPPSSSSPLLSSLAAAAKSSSSSSSSSSYSFSSSPPSIESIPSSTTVPQEFQSSVQVSSLYTSQTSSSQSSSSVGVVLSSFPAVIFTTSVSLRRTPLVSPTAGSVITSVIPRLPDLTTSYMFSSASVFISSTTAFTAINYSSTSFPSSPSSSLVLLSPSLASTSNNNLPSISTTGPSLSSSTVHISSTTLPSSTSIPIKKCHPDCQAGETCVEPWYRCIKIGENKVSLLFKMNEIQWSNDTLKKSVSRACTEYCTNQSCLELLRPAEPIRSRREIKPNLIFKGSDVLVLKNPVHWPATDKSLVVIAVVVPTYRRVISKQNLCRLIWQARHLINRYMEGPRITELDGQTQPTCVVLGGGENHEQRQGDKKESATTISVSILGVLVLLLLLFLAMFYIRRRKSKQNVPRPYHTQVSFNNQGFNENDYDYEGVEPSFSNPAYAEIDQVLNNKRQSGKSKKILRTPSVEPVKDTNIQWDNRLYQNHNEFWDPARHVRPRPRRPGNEVILNPSNLGACADVNIRPESPEYSTPIPIIPRYMSLSSNQATKSRDGDYTHLNPGTRQPSSRNQPRERGLPTNAFEGSGFHDYERIVRPGTRNEVIRWAEDASGSVLGDDYDHLWGGERTNPNRRGDHHTYDHLRRDDDYTYDHLQRGFVPQHNREYTLQFEKDDDDEVVEETII